MRRFTKSLSQLMATVGCGATLAATVAGCATSAEGSSPKAITPAQATQIADTECVGVPAKERELGILAYRDTIASTQPLRITEHVGKWTFTHDRGVMITVRAEPGMSAQWLARVASCHIALATAGRGVVDASGTDPLLVPGANVRVDEAYTGFIVSVRVSDEAATSDALKRTHALMTGPSGPATAQLGR